ncbi:unnamed protein product [Cylicostephanus goldi]|uniref:Uncharacterized protein n=1 Tax=Cylicostephanus goldi TaxID=71465 RepID=A0A3P7N2W1_CYLGO|nr:unnamed protein product [Cylicostephanus goldi]
MNEFVPVMEFEDFLEGKELVGNLFSSVFRAHDFNMDILLTKLSTYNHTKKDGPKNMFSNMITENVSMAHDSTKMRTMHGEEEGPEKTSHPTF